MTTPASGYEAGHHWVSPLNYDTAVQGDYDFPRPLTIFDSTLRKIMYTGGLRPTVDDMLRIAEELEAVGIREIIFNVDWWGDTAPETLEYEVCRAILARDFAFRTTVYSDALVPYPQYDMGERPVSAREVIETLREVGMRLMQVPLADRPTEAERARQSERLAEVISCARSLDVACTLGPVDVGRMDFQYLGRLANEGIGLGAIRVDLVDSFSSLSPEAMKLFVSRFKACLATPVPLTMHVHNDFGLGSATAIAAASAGANPDVSVNGLSYRAGFAALEEVAVSLELLYGVPTGLRLDRLQRLSDLVAERIGLPNHPLKAVTGPQAFIRELPLWVVQYLEGGPDGFPPPASCFAPSVVGARMRARWGNHYSNFVIRAKLRQMGLRATEDRVLEIRQRIRSGVEMLVDYPRWLPEEEVEAICRAVAGERTPEQEDG